MKRGLFVILVGVTLIGMMAGCANSYFLKPALNSTDDAEVYYLDGVPIIASYGDEIDIDLSCQRTGKELALTVSVYNYSDRAIDVRPEKIEVYGFDSQLQRKYLKVYTAAGYMGRVRRRQALAAGLQGTADAMEEYSASTSTSTTSGYTTGSATVYGDEFYTVYGRAREYSTAQTYDPGKAAEERARNEAVAERTQQQNVASNVWLESRLLKRTTLPSQYGITGLVVAKYKHCSDKIIVKIPVGNETHVFRFYR